MTAKMSYHIDAPVESVFDFFKDPSNQVDSAPFSAMKVHDAKETKEGVGSFYSWSVKMLGIPVEGFEVFTDFVPNKRITEKSSNSLVGTWEYIFEPAGDRTRITMLHHPRGIWSAPAVRTVLDIFTRKMTEKVFLPRLEDAIKAMPEPHQHPRSSHKRAVAASR